MHVALANIARTQAGTNITRRITCKLNIEVPKHVRTLNPPRPLLTMCNSPHLQERHTQRRTSASFAIIVYSYRKHKKNYRYRICINTADASNFILEELNGIAQPHPPPIALIRTLRSPSARQ